MQLGILGVRPAQAEVLGLEEVGGSLFTRLVVGVGEGELAVKLVVDLITGINVQGPGTKGIVVSGYGKVEIIPEHEVHTGVPEIEASGGFFTERGHQQTGGPCGLLRHESEGEAEGDGDIGNNRPGGAEHRFLRRLGYDLCHRQFKIIMGMLKVANGVHAVFHIDGAVRHHLDLLALQEAVRLVRYHIGDTRLVGVEVIPELLHLVGLLALGHLRLAFHLPGSGILAAGGENRIGFHIILDEVGLQRHILVCDRGAAVIVDHAPAIGEVGDDRVLGSGKGGAGEGTAVQQVQ